MRAEFRPLAVLIMTINFLAPELARMLPRAEYAEAHITGSAEPGGLAGFSFGSFKLVGTASVAARDG